MHNSRILGVLAILSSNFLFYFGTLPIRWAKEYGSLGGTEFIFTRFLLGSLIVCLYQLAVGRFPKFDRPSILVGRVVFHFLAGWLYYLCIAESNAATGNVLHMTYPLFASLILLVAGKSRSPLADVVLSTVSVAGIFLTGNVAGSGHALLLGLLSGVAGALSVISLSTTRKGNSTIDVFFVTFLGGLLLTYIVAQPSMEISSPIEVWLLLLSAACGIGGQFCFTYGALYLQPVEASVLSCLRIPIALLGAAIGLEMLVLDWQSWLGALLVFSANIVVIKRRARSA